MNWRERVQRLDTLEKWIRGETACNPNLIKQRWGVSDKTARTYINDLRELNKSKGYDITYDRNQKEYLFKKMDGKKDTAK